MTLFSFEGFVRDIKYTPCLYSKLKTYDIKEFDVNKSASFGLIALGCVQNNLAFSKWVSPKRTRSYPFARIYNTYYLNTKIVTIIPIIKDEGKAGDNDRLNFITFSWMNLLNVYIILAWYDDADVKSNGKLTKQRMDASYVRTKIEEIASYQMSALHWNTTHFQRDFDTIYLRAVDSYQKIARNQQSQVHSKEQHLEVLQKFQKNNVFDLDKFKNFSLPTSLNAANREALTSHKLEHLKDGGKGIFTISNYLGGKYYLTVDEVYQEGSNLVLQESKNNSSGGKLPTYDDIKDGLFKLILFSNLDSLWLDDKQVSFTTRLKLTGNIRGKLSLPTDNLTLQNFCTYNMLKSRGVEMIKKLNQEVSINSNLSISISGNQ